MMMRSVQLHVKMLAGHIAGFAAAMVIGAVVPSVMLAAMVLIMGHGLYKLYGRSLFRDDAALLMTLPLSARDLVLGKTLAVLLWCGGMQLAGGAEPAGCVGAGDGGKDADAGRGLAAGGHEPLAGRDQRRVVGDPAAAVYGRFLSAAHGHGAEMLRTLGKTEPGEADTDHALRRFDLWRRRCRTSSAAGSGEITGERSFLDGDLRGPAGRGMRLVLLPQLCKNAGEGVRSGISGWG